MLNKNRRNSSKPPTTDYYARNKTRCQKYERKVMQKTSGQKGYQDTKLKMSYTRMKLYCINIHSNCGSDIDSVQSNSFDHRQVFDIPLLK